MNKPLLKLLLGLTLVLLLPSIAYAQLQYTVVASCGAETLPIGAKGAPYMDVTGKICSSAVGGSSTFTWPGTAGIATGGATTAGTMPYVNSYIVGGAASFTWPGTAGNAAGGATTAGTMPYVNSYIVGGAASFTWPGTAGNATGGTTTAGTMPYVNAYIVGGGAGGGTSSNFGAAFPVAGTAAGGEYLSSPPTLTTGQMVALQTNVNGALKVDGTGVTQPISVASLPLPLNAATSILQPTNAAIGSTTAGQTGNLEFGAVTTAAPTYTTGQSNVLSLTTSGGLRTDSTTWGGTAITNVPTAVGTVGTGNTPTVNAYIVGGGGAGGTSSNFGAAFPVAGTAAGGEYLSSPPTLTTGQMVALQTDINGALKVDETAVRSAPGTPQTIAITVQGNASGIPIPVTGASGGGPVTAITGAFVDCSIVAIGCTTDAPWTLSGVATSNSLLKAIALGSTSSYNYQQSPIATTITSGASYAAGTGIGGPQTVSVLRTTTQPTMLLTQFSLVLTNVPVAGPPTYEVFISTKAFTAGTCTDNTAMSLSNGDAQYLLPGSPFNITPAAPTAGTTIAFGAAPVGVMPISVQNMDGTPTTSIYICLISGTAWVNPASTTGPVINLGGIRD